VTSITMTNDEALAFMTARDREARELYRMTKADLAAIYQGELAARGLTLLCGGPASRGELGNDILTLRYPTATLNLAIHVVHHKPGEHWSACEHCNPA
jgi:hypothetical protein